MNSQHPSPPTADRRPREVRSPHGVRIDEYYWLRDDARRDPDVIAYLEAENAWTTAQLAHLDGLRDRLYHEITGRIPKVDASAPYRYRGYYYYRRFVADGEYPIIARKPGSPAAEEQILLDGNALARGHEFFAIGDYEVSPDGSRLAWAEDTVGRGQYTIRFRDLGTGEILPDRLPNCDAEFAWSDDNRTLLYVENDAVTLLGVRVLRHRLGAEVPPDRLVYELDDDNFVMSLERTGDEKFILLQLNSTVSDEVHALPADLPDGTFRVLLPRERNHEYEVDHIANRWIIRSNWKARNFRILEAADNEIGEREHWKELVPHDENVLVEGFDVFADHLVLAERRDGLGRIRVCDRSGRRLFDVAADDPAYVIDLDVNPEQDTRWLRYSYTSLTTPETIYEIDMRTQERRMLKQQPVPGGFESAHYAAERFFVAARDGARVPVSLLYRKGFRCDGSAPLYQYAYGSYGLSTEPDFDGEILSLVDRGFVYAIAHVRGGQELGRAWYEAGRLKNKLNTFTDFIDVTEHLVAAKYAHPRKIVAAGRSAGGLLIGAVANFRPDLYAALIADVPFVDVVTTMLDESIPLTTLEYDEWGDPKDRSFYDYMLGYSPYDNVAARDYPAMLVTTGLWDDAVQYFEPAKWVARLRARGAGKRPVLLHVNMDAGHRGQSGRFRRNRELAMEFAFLLDQLGLAGNGRSTGAAGPAAEAKTPGNAGRKER